MGAPQIAAKTSRDFAGFPTTSTAAPRIIHRTLDERTGEVMLDAIENDDLSADMKWMNSQNPPSECAMSSFGRDANALHANAAEGMLCGKRALLRGFLASKFIS
jgi:hypothetical protein